MLAGLLLVSMGCLFVLVVPYAWRLRGELGGYWKYAVILIGLSVAGDLFDAFYDPTRITTEWYWLLWGKLWVGIWTLVGMHSAQSIGLPSVPSSARRRGSASGSSEVWFSRSWSGARSGSG